MRDKRQLTRALIELLPKERRPDLKSVMPVWWYNIRPAGGMRLTDRGYDAFCNLLEIEHYRFPLENLVLRTLVTMDQRLQSPYYVEIEKKIPRTLILFGSQEAVLINLYGNLQQFLDNYTT
jgi:hypothetical protein